MSLREQLRADMAASMRSGETLRRVQWLGLLIAFGAMALVLALLASAIALSVERARDAGRLDESLRQEAVERRQRHRVVVQGLDRDAALACRRRGDAHDQFRRAGAVGHDGEADEHAYNAEDDRGHEEGLHDLVVVVTAVHIHHALYDNVESLYG